MDILARGKTIALNLLGADIEENRFRFHPPDAERKGGELTPPARDP